MTDHLSIVLKLKLTVKDPKYIADIQKKIRSNTELSLKNTNCLNKYNLDQRHRTAYLLKMVQTSLCRYLSSYDIFCSYWTLYESYPGTLRTSIKSPNISGRCHFPILFFKQMGKQGNSMPCPALLTESTRDYSTPAPNLSMTCLPC